VAHGASGSQVTAVANTGYTFASWSDGNTSATRTDSNVTGNLSVTATFTQNVVYEITPVDTQHTELGVSLSFTSVSAPGGNVDIQPLTGLTPPAGYSIPAGASYEINTTATYGGTITVCLNYSGTFADESSLKLFHRVGSSWVNITNLGGVDTVNNKVCGTTTTLSPFTIAAPVSSGGTTPVPVMDGWWLLPAALAGAGLLYRRRRS
jgi:uncharacterized repeat protein (TIGR02543 family)/MYXO-CTERM domain-containing protein